MSKIFIALVTILYTGATIGYILDKQYAMALIFGSYAIANVGFLIL